MISRQFKKNFGIKTECPVRENLIQIFCCNVHCAPVPALKYTHALLDHLTVPKPTCRRLMKTVAKGGGHLLYHGTSFFPAPGEGTKSFSSSTEPGVVGPPDSSIALPQDGHPGPGKPKSPPLSQARTHLDVRANSRRFNGQ